MSYEEETEYSTTNYRCIDPIGNLRIKIILQPVKNLYIPLPQFDVEHKSPEICPSHEDDELETEEYTFNWQEKVLSRSEIKKYTSENDWKKKILEKYHDNIKDGLTHLKNHSNKLFSYVESDNYSIFDSKLNIFSNKASHLSSLSKRINDLKISPNIRNYKTLAKRKIINYYPSDDFKNQAHLVSNIVQKMFIMIDLGSKIIETNKTEHKEHLEGVLCHLSYDSSTSVLQVTPSFSKSEFKPYTIGIQNENGRNLYYYWIYHASQSIKTESLTKEIQLMSKVLDYQEEVKKLQIDTEFFVGKPDHMYITLLGEIISAQDFDFDSLHIHYFVKLPLGCGYTDIDSLMGRTQTCNRNSEGVFHFSHLFEMNFCVKLESFNDLLAAPPELFFEVLSVDKYRRYRNEGYTYITVPKTPGMYNYSLRCWCILDKTFTSQLKRFFIGGGPELEDVSYVGLSTSKKPEIMSRFGLETTPSGCINVNLKIIQQSKNFAEKIGEKIELERSITKRLDAGSLLGSVNAVLEAFRKARERMLEAKKGLQTNFNYISPETQQSDKKCD